VELLSRHHLTALVCQFLLTLILLAYTSLSIAEPIASPRGKKLHDEDCLICHQPEKYYLRKNRIVNTYPRLVVQVLNCQLDVGAEWDADEFLDVFNYVNNNYYKLKLLDNLKQ